MSYIKRKIALDMFDIASSEDELLSLIKNLPAADVRENVRGEWETDSDNLPVCSKCGKIALQRVFVKVPQLIQDVRMVHSNYCPNCGADMKGER